MILSRRLALAGCVLLALGLRVGRLLERPFLHSDSPGYIAMADELTGGRWSAAFSGYYPPGYPLVMAAAHGLGFDWEVAGRAVALAAGLAAVPLAARLGAAMIGPEVAIGSAVLAAVHPQLVRASAEILPETLYGVLVILWALLVLRHPLRTGHLAAAGALGALASLVRVEGVILVFLTAYAGWSAGARLRGVMAALAAATLVLAPVALTVHEATGAWVLSGKEMPVIARKYGVAPMGVLGLVFGHPAAFASRYPFFFAHQVAYTLNAISALLVVPLAVGLATGAPDPRAHHARRLVIATVLAFTAGIAVANAGRRYVVPFLPLLFPWTVLGARRLAALAPRPWLVPLVASVALVILAAGGLKAPDRGKPGCYRRVCARIHERFGEAPPPIMTWDHRVAYLCGARFVPEPDGPSTEAIAARARTGGARLWVASRRHRPHLRAPEGFAPILEPCSGSIVIFEVPPSN